MNDSTIKAQNNAGHQLTALDDYINKVYKLVLLLIPGACQCAGLAYTFEKLMGWLPTVNWTLLILFDISCMIYLAVGIFFIKTGIKDGLVKPQKLKAAKLFILILLIIQFNFILYMIPATDFWGFAFFFVVLTAFLLDYKLTLVASAEIAGSLAVAWIFPKEHTLPAKDIFFIPNILDRILAVGLALPTIALLVYFIKKYLLNAKKDELERNNARVQNVLSAVRVLSVRMLEAGSSLSDISSSVASSAENLSATSEGLLEGSNTLRQKAGSSMDNLNMLRESGEKLSENVRKVGENSGEVMKKSADNEKALDSLQIVNKEVIASMNETNEVADKLSEAVKGIDSALNMISDIATQTKILSINASIEAARAGAAGKGFSVVAQEVGNLAGSTAKSLSEIRTVMGRIRQNVADMTAYVGENNKKLVLQNEYFAEVFGNMQEINLLLRQSIKDISSMNEVHESQSEIISHTVDITSDIAESIENENREFTAISNMVGSNAKDASLIEKQVAAINEMTEQLGELLK